MMTKGDLILVPSIGICRFIKKTYHGWRWDIQVAGKNKYYNIDPVRLKAKVTSRKLRGTVVFRPFVEPEE